MLLNFVGYVEYYVFYVKVAINSIRSMKKYLILIFLYCCFIEVSYGFCPEDSLLCRVYFQVGSSSLDLSFSENSRHLDSLLSHVSTLQKQDVLHHVSLISSASPEGDSGVNLTLSDKRCNAVRSYLQEHLCLPDSVFVSSSFGTSMGRSCLSQRF